jgi:hypothetical protein
MMREKVALLEATAPMFDCFETHNWFSKVLSECAMYHLIHFSLQEGEFRQAS